MPDPRVSKLAQVLVQYSLDLQPGELFTLSTSPLAEELSLEVYKEAVKAGAHITVQNSLPGTEEIFYKFVIQIILYPRIFSVCNFILRLDPEKIFMYAIHTRC